MQLSGLCGDRCMADARPTIDTDILLQRSPQLVSKSRNAFKLAAYATPSTPPTKKKDGTVKVQPASFEAAKGPALKQESVSQRRFQRMSRLRSKLDADETKMQIEPVEAFFAVENANEPDEMPQPQRVAVFAQAANLGLLPGLTGCITNVGAAQQMSRGTVDVYVSVPLAEPNLLPDMKNWMEQEIPALCALEVNITQNKGADMGQFLQQMQSASGREYDAVLKIHTKSDTRIRETILHNLCGTTYIAQSILASFKANPGLGLVGVDGWVGWKGEPQGSPSFGGLWTAAEQDNMKRTWSLIAPGRPLPPKDTWAAAVASFWWSSGRSVTNNPLLLAAAPRLLAHMNWGYVTGSQGLPEHALERLIGTMVRADGAAVLRVMC